jgi:hypothetical protein
VAGSIVLTELVGGEPVWRVRIGFHVQRKPDPWPLWKRRHSALRRLLLQRIHARRQASGKGPLVDDALLLVREQIAAVRESDETQENAGHSRAELRRLHDEHVAEAASIVALGLQSLDAAFVTIGPDLVGRHVRRALKGDPSKRGGASNIREGDVLAHITLACGAFGAKAKARPSSADVEREKNRLRGARSRASKRTRT